MKHQKKILIILNSHLKLLLFNKDFLSIFEFEKIKKFILEIS